MRKLIFIILLMFYAFTTKAQNNLILNGSFEQNNISSCSDYFNNTSTNIVSDVTNYSGSFTYLMEDSCVFCTPPVYWCGGAAEGNWFLLMEGDYNSNGASKISFDLETPLTIEHNYQLSFYIKQSPFTAPCQSDPKNNYIKVGISNSATTFGTHLITSPLGGSIWQKYSLVFNTQNAEEYLTVESGVNDTNLYVIFVDNFVLVETTSSAVNELNSNNKKLIKITDILGKESSPNKKGLLFYMYSDGTVEKRMVIE